jgi:hypothetical protein
VELLDWWRTAAKDPDTEPVQWLKFGAPAGILLPVVDRGIFPTYDPTIDTVEVDPEQLQTECNFTNYAGIDGDPDIDKEVKRIIGNKYVDRYASVEAAEAALGAPVILSKIGAVKKWKQSKDVHSGWKSLILKMRMVIDSKQSGVSRATRKQERTQLPRASDIVKDVMSLLAPFASHLKLDELLEFLIADFRDAFFIIPNHPKERRFFAVRYGGEILVFTKTTQGSRGAPLTWARLAALITRLTQSVTGLQASRISTYVDDPIVAAVGSRRERRRIFAMTLALWSALGLPLALEKAQIGHTVTWTSATFVPTTRGLDVTVKETIVNETIQMCEQFFGQNYVTHKSLRCFIGKAMHIASLVSTVRPFINELYAALHCGQRMGPTDSSVWLKQVDHSVTWLHALLTKRRGTLTRHYDLGVYYGRGPTIDMCLDASPWGLGGFLTEQGRITSWFACGLSTAEVELLGITVGTSASQQVVEALVALVALRGWSNRWARQRAQLKVRSDSISALVLCLKLKTKGTGTTIVAREVALDIADSVYAPHIAEHIPGVENVVSDMLSRKYAPGTTFMLPKCLEGVEELVLPPRDRAYFVASKLPSEHSTRNRGNKRRSWG